MTDQPAVVIDNGTGMMKSGLAGDDAPKSYIPTQVGSTKYEAMIGANYKDFAIGQELVNKGGLFKINSPIEHGYIENFDYMKVLWDYIYNQELKKDPVNQPVLVTEAAFTPK